MKDLSLSERAEMLRKAFDEGYFDADTIFSEGPESVLKAVKDFEKEDKKNDKM